MALTFGFYNSTNGDRKYNAIQMASIFDGIIRDGILMTIGKNFVVTADGGLGVLVGSGRAWFDHTWTYNDSDMPTTVKSADVLLDRIDALVLEVDTRDESRLNSIRWVHGTPAAIATRPTLTREPYVNQYPLAYIEVPRGTTEILQSHITNMVGTTDTPFVTAPLETIDTTALLAQWTNQWLLLLDAMQGQKGTQQSEWELQTAQQQEDFEHMRVSWDAWFATIKVDLARYVQFNFDNIAALGGTTILPILVDGDTMTETMVITGTNIKVAEIVTDMSKKMTDKTLTETETVYEADGVTALRVAVMVTDLTTGRVTVL